MSDIINNCFNYFDDINNNFLTTKQEPKMRVQLIEEQKYNEVVYWVKIDDTIVAMKTTYEAAKEEFDKAVAYEPRQTILEEKEI